MSKKKSDLWEISKSILLQDVSSDRVDEFSELVVAH